jgi:hypothetical protein
MPIARDAHFRAAQDLRTFTNRLCGKRTDSSQVEGLVPRPVLKLNGRDTHGKFSAGNQNLA